jgi:hypothetical protein
MSHDFWLLSVLALASSVQAQPDLQSHEQPQLVRWQTPLDRPTAGSYVGEPGIKPEILTEGFLSAHPDLRWRREGLYSYNKKQYDIAMDQFRRAARYGDKPSQAMLAEMYWEGIGTKQDRGLGYAWMDLAAERRYANFLIMRERYWRKLDAAQQQDAIERGQPLLAEYGDDIAKPRMSWVLKRARLTMTGTRTGSLGMAGPMRIIPMTGPLAGSGLTLSGEDYYQKKYWAPKEYWEWQDEVWSAPREGKVEVGDVEPVHGAKQADGKKP